MQPLSTTAPASFKMPADTEVLPVGTFANVTDDILGSSVETRVFTHLVDAELDSATPAA